MTDDYCPDCTENLDDCRCCPDCGAVTEGAWCSECEDDDEV